MSDRPLTALEADALNEARDAKAKFTAAMRRLKAAREALELSKRIIRDRVEEAKWAKAVKLGGWQASGMPYYEFMYCAPANPDLSRYTHATLTASEDGAPTAPIHHAPESYEHSTLDIGLAAWVETGQHLRWESRFNYHRLDMEVRAWLDTRPREFDDVHFPRTIEPGVYHMQDWFYVNEDADRVKRDEEALMELRHQSRTSELSSNRMWLALEFGLDMEASASYRLSDDDPRELRCDNRGHIDEHDRWKV